ncbi:putative membrane protein [Pullulanibacillus pueri]|uniref:Membrane protein n=1 Tax=Pullulanibacillus pueri TaxID=1437324 RepID=A0A8J2ZU22_9BACL|nr:DUF819 family protein [Pullulanibacillus pueri]MBM7681264.1 putative membrane protein [Pullulanibacillus pueri]GGH77831.1 membrane protein [Pullulanibacillus pueri]
MHQTLISANDTWVLWAILAGWAAVSIYLEQRFKWAAKLTGAIIALLGALILSNLYIIPTDAPTYDAVWNYVIPLAIPLLLFQANLRKIWNESGRMLIIFLISSIGTVVGVTLSFFFLKNAIPDLDKIAGMETGSYIGGSVNFAALAAKFHTPGELVSSAIVADNLLMAFYFFILIAMPALSFFRKHFRTPYIDAIEKDSTSGANNQAASYWKGKEVSLKDIALAAGSAFVLVALSFKLANWFDKLIPSGDHVNFFYNLLNGLFGDHYLMLTTITVLAVSIFHRFFENINGAQELGTYLIYIFFVVIGVPASVPLLIENAPLLLIFVLIIIIGNMIVTLIFGKLFKFSLEEMILASNANAGGPTTAAAMAIAKGWTELIVPILVVGTLGYIIGNYIGTAMEYLLSHVM